MVRFRKGERCLSKRVESIKPRASYRCILIATILSPANVEGRYLAKMASTRAFHDCRRRIGDDVLDRPAGQDPGGAFLGPSPGAG